VYQSPQENEYRQQAAGPQPLFVPKRFGVGYSFNWQNPKAVAIFFGLLLVPVVVALVTLLVVVLIVHR
jgi:uncharacterized membrane protein